MSLRQKRRQTRSRIRTLYHLVVTELGWVGIAGTDGRISRLVLPRRARCEAVQALREGITGELVETKHDFSGEADRLAAYFAGEHVEFQCRIDVPRASEFDRRVWDAAREIQYGTVRSYGWIAARIGQPGAARAVGQALGRNPIPLIVPCHRVIRSDGTLGGFGCGVDWKRRLLVLEGIGAGD